jgi:comEA protein
MIRSSIRPGRASLRALLVACALALVVPAAIAAQGAAGSGDARPSLVGKVNVNTASAEELQLLPGVGESRARAIIEARKAQGGFRSLDQLVEVKGIGQTLLQQLRPHLTLTGKTTAHKP